jgi:hypothetical protein
VPPERREEQNNVAGFIYAVLGLAYAVLLAFVVIAVWQDYNTAQTNVESEAHELSGVYFLASREEAGEQGVDPAFVVSDDEGLLFVVPPLGFATSQANVQAILGDVHPRENLRRRRGGGVLKLPLLPCRWRPFLADTGSPRLLRTKWPR